MKTQIPAEALERMEKEGWPSIQEQTDHWNRIEGLELERVMDIRAESPNERSETDDAKATIMFRGFSSLNVQDLGSGIWMLEAKHQ